MDFFDKKLSNRPLWDTKFVTLEQEALLTSIRAMLVAFLIIEVGLEILILLVEIMDELEPMTLASITASRECRLERASATTLVLPFLCLATNEKLCKN